MSFFVERDPPFVASLEAPNDFASQVEKARGLSSQAEKAQKMSQVMIRAQEAGFVLPLIHFSSFAVAKPGIDLSDIPNSDETIPFSKVRIK